MGEAMAKAKTPGGVIVPPTYQQPYDDMDGEHRALWRDVVQSQRSDWFAPSHRPMLRDYVDSAILAHELKQRARELLAADDVKTATELMAHAATQSRVMLAAARSLRITMQSQRPPPKNTAEKARETRAAADDQLGWESMFESDDGFAN